MMMFRIIYLCSFGKLAVFTLDHCIISLCDRASGLKFDANMRILMLNTVALTSTLILVNL